MTNLELIKEAKNMISKYFIAKKQTSKNETINKKASKIQDFIIFNKIESDDKWINAFKNGQQIGSMTRGYFKFNF